MSAQFSRPLLALFLALTFLGKPANAQTEAVAGGVCPYWIDVKTGKPLLPSQTVPIGVGPEELYRLQTTRDVQAHGGSGRNYFRQSDGPWTDSATGQSLSGAQTVPIGVGTEELYRLQTTRDVQAHGGSGRNYALIPCPPPQAAASSGLYVGGELVKNWGWVRSTERLAVTDVVTNQFSDRADPVGGGFLIGYKFAPWANSVIVSPFASFDFINAPVNHTFANGSYLGTTANFMGTGGVKIGPQFGNGFWLYGIAGMSVLNETLKINFIPVFSSSSATVAGGTVGVGAAFKPGFLQGFGRAVSVFAEYQHTWWQDANFNTPAASPFFNYTFARQDDVVKVGFTVDLSPVAAGPRYAKALPPK